MNASKELRQILRVLLIPPRPDDGQGGLWVAQMLDVDVCATGATAEEALVALGSTWGGYEWICEEEGAGLGPPAPLEMWQMAGLNPSGAGEGPEPAPCVPVDCLYDPPSGWMYGFPKPWPNNLPFTTENLEGQLVADGYPEMMARDLGKYTRLLSAKE